MGLPQPRDDARAGHLGWFQGVRTHTIPLRWEEVTRAFRLSPVSKLDSRCVGATTPVYKTVSEASARTTWLQR